MKTALRHINCLSQAKRNHIRGLPSDQRNRYVLAVQWIDSQGFRRGDGSSGSEKAYRKGI